jgi:hypothetical protein
VGEDEFEYGCCSTNTDDAAPYCWEGNHTSLSFVKDGEKFIKGGSEYCWRDREYANAPNRLHTSVCAIDVQTELMQVARVERCAVMQQTPRAASGLFVSCTTIVI